MSNFTCPTCGLTNIDCGKDGYKTPREIELEKKLEIAVKALKYYAKADWWNDAIDDEDNLYKKGAFENYGYLQAQQALKEIEG